MHTTARATGISFVASPLEYNPRDVLMDIIKRAPEADRKQVFNEFCEAIGADVENNPHLRAVVWYFVINMYGQITDPRPQGHNRQAQPDLKVVREARAEQLSTIVERVKQRVMLDLEMPNGKLMRDCTGAEMAKFGNRYQKIADQVGKAKTVGSVLSEEQVKQILQ